MPRFVCRLTTAGLVLTITGEKLHRKQCEFSRARAGKARAFFSLPSIVVVPSKNSSFWRMGIRLSRLRFLRHLRRPGGTGFWRMPALRGRRSLRRPLAVRQSSPRKAPARAARQSLRHPRPSAASPSVFPSPGRSAAPPSPVPRSNCARTPPLRSPQRLLQAEMQHYAQRAYRQGPGKWLRSEAQQVLKKIVRLASVFPSPPFRSSDFAGPRRSRLYGFHTGTPSLSNRKGRGRRSDGREREPRRAGDGR